MKAKVNGLNESDTKHTKPARLWHNGWKENNEAELRKEKPVEDPPIIQPSGKRTHLKKSAQKSSRNYLASKLKYTVL